METIRQQKIAKQLQRDVADVLFQLNLNTYNGSLVTVMGSEVSPDLSIAKIYLSIFPPVKTTEIMEIIKSKAKFIRNEIGKKVRHQLRIVPEFIFYVDSSLDYVDKLEEIFKTEQPQ